MNWAQLKTILWLRWRLTRNQWAKSGGIGAIFAAIVAVMMLGLGVVGFGGGALAGATILRTVSPMVIMGIWFALTVVFLFFWMIGLLNELQRSETIDLQRLMHLPVLLGQIFAVNYVASHLALSIAIVVPSMIGLALGLAWSRGPSMLLLIPLGLSMVFMVTAWTYYVRGWLASMMANPRRRRAVIMAMSFAVILLIQLPNLYFNVIRRQDGSSRRRSERTAEQREAEAAEDRRQLETLVRIERYVPPLWVPAGAKSLAEGTAWPALAGMFGCFAIGAVGLRRAYVSTVRFYSGSTGGKSAARAPAETVATPTPAAARPAGTMLVERRVPFAPEAAGALAVATLRSMLRAPEVKMQWGISFLILLVVGSSMLFRAVPKTSATWGPFVATFGIMGSLFFMIQFLANQFGVDREGFRALVLSPADRRQILLGKNIATLPAPAVTALIQLIIICVWLRLSPVVFLASLFQLVGGVLVLGIGGNILSILLAYRIQPGSLKATKMPGLNVFFIVVAQFLFPVAMAPLLLGPLAGVLAERFGGMPAALGSLVMSAIVAMAICTIYWWSLGPLGRLLQRRETKILQTVTAEVE